MHGFYRARTLHCVLSVAACLSYFGCGGGPPAQKEAAPPKPEITLQVGSLNLSNLNRRIEKKDVSNLARILKREQVEILAVHGVTRYPGVETRVDFVNELSAQTEMRNAFGEMMNSSGRQTGNCVFSAYPFHNNVNVPFTGIKSATFEAALQTAVDGGVRDIMVVSTEFPAKAPADELSLCVKVLASLNPSDNRMPMIVAGNLPSSESVRSAGSFDDTQSLLGSSKSAPTRIWYSGKESIKALSARVVESELGTVMIVQFGIFRQMRP